MTAAVDYLGYRKLRAPHENGTGLFEPTWEQVGELVNRNTENQSKSCYDVQGKCLNRLAYQARKEMLAAARQWTGSYRDLGDWATASLDRVFLAGHQPQMFHPGVWLKNFALSRLAEQHDAVAVNLVVDSDTIRSHTLRVPGGTVKSPNTAEIPYDASGPPVPFEERQILDRPLFASFADRVQTQIRSLVPSPLIGQYWRLVRNRARDCNRLGMCLAQARHVLEGEWGGQTLELPQSAVCDCDAFRWFLCHLLNESARFRVVHNDVVREYRRVHRIRSSAHPVADLAEQDGWHEVPIWIWTLHAPRRRRLFVRRVGNELQLSNRRDLQVSLPLSHDGDASRAVECLQNLHRDGIRLRSRALITTMWARLALGNLFLHGIGGAKYDQVTDALIAGFFRLKPPGFLTVSGTLHLQAAHCNGAASRIRVLRDRLRQIEFQPERFVGELELVGAEQMAEIRQIQMQKWDWIEKNDTLENYRERFLSIRRLNQKLQTWVKPIRDDTIRALEKAEQASHAASILTWREYAFCLFPGEDLQVFFARLLPKRV